MDAQPNSRAPVLGQPGSSASAVAALAQLVWDDEETVRTWMLTPHPELDGSTPADAARSEAGARRVEDLLNRIRYGLPV